jgi:hypothetical protein
MTDALRERLREILRETYEGGLPGEGTEYLDHQSGIWATLRPLTAARASARLDGHPSIAAHARHMAFHLRVTAEWMRGIRVKRDWIGSFEPQTVNEAEWQIVQRELDDARTDFFEAMVALPDEEFLSEGAGAGAVAHLAYHLGAIRQLVHRV